MTPGATSTIEREALPQTLRRNLCASHGDGAAFGVMVGLGETYLPAFVLAVGLGEVFAGLIASVPLLAGGVMQMISPMAVRRLRSHRRWVLMCAAAQALSFAPLVFAAVVGRIPAALAMLVATAYWAAGLATGPAWNTWIGTLVPRPVRARFFARRTRLSQFAVLVGFLLGGVALHAGRNSGRELEAFALLFAAATVFRLMSTGFLALHSEPVPLPPQMRAVTYRSLWRELRMGAGGRLLTYLVCVQAAVQFAGPYFTPFMLRELQLDYGAFVFLIALSFVAKIAALPMWGRVSHRFGAMPLLWIGGVGIIPLPAMWLASENMLWLGFIQLFGGVGWAAYELAFFLLFFESIPEDERTSVLTLYNLANTAAWVGGSLLGAVLLKSLGATHNAYLTLFAISTGLRLLTLAFLWRVGPLSVVAAAMGVRTLSLRPSSASIDAPVLPSLPDETDTTEEHVSATANA